MPKIIRSHTAINGKRAAKGRESSIVRIYERGDAPGRIWVERAWVVTDSGNPIPRPIEEETSWEEAVLLAEETALARRRRLTLGRTDPQEAALVTVKQLLDAYHGGDNPRVKGWSEGHAASQARYRTFWESELGAGTPVERVSPAKVEGCVSRAGTRLKWSEATQAKYLKYAKAVSRWGYRKAQILSRDPWDPVDLPESTPDTRALLYGATEVRALVTPNPDVDWRVTVVASIAADTGRRLSAIRHLWRGVGEDPFSDESDFAVLLVQVRDQAGDDTRELERMFLHFRPEFDKGDRDQWVPVSEETRAIVTETLTRGEVEASGWLVPEGRMDFEDARDKPMGASALIRALHVAEERLGIRRVKGRGFHGIKRRHVTVGDELAGGDLSLVGDVTGNRSPEVLRTRYRFPELGRMVAQVDRIRARIGRESGHEHGHEKEADPTDT